MQEKHYCKDCENFAHGFCVIHKGKINKHTFSGCLDFVQATDTESDASKRERRKRAEPGCFQRDIERGHNDEKQKNSRIKWGEILKDGVILNSKLAAKDPPEGDNYSVRVRLQMDQQSEPARHSLHDYSRPKNERYTKEKDVVYAFKVQDEALVNRYLEVEKERNILREELDTLREKLSRTIDKLQFDGSTDQLYDWYKDAAEEKKRYKEKLDAINYEVKETISLMESFPTSDITAQRLFIKYMSDLLKICQIDGE